MIEVTPLQAGQQTAYQDFLDTLPDALVYSSLFRISRGRGR
jgi:hypothetical protein